MTTIRHNYLPNLQEQFSYNDEITFWISHDTGDLHISTDGKEQIIPFEIGIRIVDLLAKKQEVIRESKKRNWVKILF